MTEVLRTERRSVTSLLDRDGISRRRFLSLSVGVVGLALLGACGEEEYSDPEVDQVAISAGDIPAVGDTPLHNKDGRFYLIHNENGLLALSSRCTHKGCVVGWDGDGDEFHCPCHDSIYDRHGVNTGGPAPRPLDLVKIAAGEDGGVVIQTGSITEREEWSPDQVYPFSD